MSENLFSSDNKGNSTKYVENWDKIFGKKRMKLFSYGTLMSGQSRNSTMTSLGGKKLKNVEVEDLRLYGNSDHPTVRKEDGHIVLGEIWEFERSEDEILSRLDRIEGYPSYYGREKIEIEGDSVWVYIMTDGAFNFQIENKSMLPIENGNWKDKRNG